MENAGKGGSEKPELPLWKKVLFYSILLAFLIVASEVGVRLLGFYPLPALSDKPGVQAYFWISDEKLGFRNRSDGKYRYTEIIGNPLVTTDKYGFRNGNGWNPDNNEPAIVFVGDSTVFCAEVNDDETVPSEVSKLLSDLNVSVLNAGVRGYNTVQSKRMLEECLKRYPSIKVAVYNFCSNDLEGNFDADRHYPARTPTIRWNGKTNRYCEVEVDKPVVYWGQSFEQWIRRKKEEDAKKVSSKRYDRIVRDRLREQSALFNTIQTLYSKLNELFFTGRSDQKRKKVIEKEAKGIERILFEMKKVCDEKGVVFYATRFPEKKNGHIFEAACKKYSIPFVPLSKYIPDDDNSYKACYVGGGFDPHFNHKGTREFALAVEPVLRKALEQPQTPR